MISTLIYNAKFGDKLAMEQLLHKFHPLLKKYANKLKYEDALSELTLFFIELVHKIPMQMLQSANEGKLVKYIDTGVQNQYYYLLKKLIFISKEVNSSTISDEQMHFLESSLATTDEITSENIFYILKPYLSLILSRLVDTFISKISLTMLPVPKPHNTACVLSWEEARRWQSRSSGYSSS